MEDGGRRGERSAGRICYAALAGLLAAILCPPSSVLPAQSPLRAVTFNIRYGTANDGAHAWPNRRAHVITTIRDHAPHLLGLQEALHFQLEELRTALPRYQAIGVGRDDGATKGEYAAIMVDTARFAIESSGTTWFSDTPTVPGSKHWGNNITRIMTWALLRDRTDDERVWLYNLHLDHESQPSRERSVAFLLAEHERRAASQRARDANDAEISGARSEPRLMVMGDFNSNEQNPAYQAALAARLRSAFRVIDPTSQQIGTFNGFKDQVELATGVIDHILVDHRWRVVDAGIDTRKFGPLWPSDHFPVWAILKAQ
jgi:endonuclease/exonuclease/phosphatase family metal-dependent hydrolase